MMKGRDFIGTYHPFPSEDPSSWRNKVDKRQLDLFVDYVPPKLSWRKRLIIKWKRRLFRNDFF